MIFAENVLNQQNFELGINSKLFDWLEIWKTFLNYFVGSYNTIYFVHIYEHVVTNFLIGFGVILNTGRN
jgi:hypothetical protein